MTYPTKLITQDRRPIQLYRSCPRQLRTIREEQTHIVDQADKKIEISFQFPVVRIVVGVNVEPTVVDVPEPTHNSTNAQIVAQLPNISDF